METTDPKDDKVKTTAENTAPEQQRQVSPDEKYKYHETQAANSENPEAFPDKPKNHTTNEERLMDTDDGSIDN